jgi:hypothetical protein
LGALRLLNVDGLALDQVEEPGIGHGHRERLRHIAWAAVEGSLQA